MTPPTLRLDALSYGGNAVGRLQGKAVFIPGGAPGDEIRCRIVREKKRHAEGELEELLVAGPGRRTPPCPVFGDCGGCQWQHLDYGEQSLWKERIFAETLRRQCGIDQSLLRPLVVASDEWGYRSRVQFKCRQTEGGFALGFYRRGSHFVIDVPRCAIADPRINDALGHFRTWLVGSPSPGRISQVDMAVGDIGGVRVVVHLADEDPGPLARYLTPLAMEAGLALFIQYGRKETLRHCCGAADLTIGIAEPEISLEYGPGGFAQVNLAQNRRMVQLVEEAADLSGTEQVLDLFCGMGNFSLPLARRAGEVVGVEDFAPSIVKARENAQRNGIGNTVFHACPAETSALRFRSPAGFDLVVLDPPRAGAFEVVKDLVRARPRRILYVSCDPPTLARDLMPLLQSGYTLAWSRAIDLFPQTYHTESLTLLTWGG
jgi:23S rRNA (uracil1939-C5)-methyltransferase